MESDASRKIGTENFGDQRALGFDNERALTSRGVIVTVEADAIMR